uniref:non-specific serine/threonine protein kinase n=1 Tax=Kalanchoe fedtschenkoi TaxID=63787 RepID=A0A7N0TA08_KALFE
MGLLRCIRLNLWSKSRQRIMECKSQNLQMVEDDVKRPENRVVKELSWEEVERLTGNLSKVIDHGGFSTVYLGTCPSSSTAVAAFKIQNSSEKLDQIFKEELNINLHIQHDSIVKLIGYCNGQARKALVFEYIPNGTLQEKLHGKVVDRGLNWKARMRIAFQLAQTIEYLHEKCGLSLVHHDLKPSNILLDDDFNFKLCDFGSAKHGSSSGGSLMYPSRKQVMLGSPGYIDPNYLKTGIASKMNDIYSFGVLVLELMTGMEASALDKSLAGSASNDIPILTELVDPVLCGNFELEEARAMVSVTVRCLHHEPSLRPSATEIIQIMKQRVPSVSLPGK